MNAEKKGHRGAADVDVEDFNPRPIPEGEIEKMLDEAPDYIKARAKEWGEQRNGAHTGDDRKL